MKNGSIVTVGISPAWDITCNGYDLQWGRHQDISYQQIRPAGKAMNICWALAWMGEQSISAGLWGENDYEQMCEAVREFGGRIKVRRTKVKGATRRNITIVDKANSREMHLRVRSELATEEALERLKRGLSDIVREGSVCVFAGSMPAEHIGEMLEIIELCRCRGAQIGIDTSGQCLKEIVSGGSLWFVKPNLEELSSLVSKRLRDNVSEICNAGRKLLDKAEVILISRGEKGAVLVSSSGNWRGRCVEPSMKAGSTVACGDFLVAGFLKGLREGGDFGSTLGTGIKAATARAWNIAGREAWARVERMVKVEVKRL